MRILIVPLLLVVILIPYRVVSGAGYIGGCKDAKEMTAFWAQGPASVSEGERDAEIRRQLRCNEFLGLTRAQVMEKLGEWTSVKEYPATAEAKKGTYLVWSHGGDTPGIGIEFTGPRGKAIDVETYEP